MPERTNIDCSCPAMAERCERPIGKARRSARAPGSRSAIDRVRVSTPSASSSARLVLLHEVPGHQLCLEGPRGVEGLAGVIWKSCSSGAQVARTTASRSSRQRHAAGELAVLAVVLDEPDPVRELAPGSATSGKRRL